MKDTSAVAFKKKQKQRNKHSFLSALYILHLWLYRTLLLDNDEWIILQKMTVLF